MRELSLKKVFAAIAGIIVLCHLKGILDALGTIYAWFSESLSAMNDFPEGAKAAIAMSLILLAIVIAFKTLNK